MGSTAKLPPAEPRWGFEPGEDWLCLRRWMHILPIPMGWEGAEIRPGTPPCPREAWPGTPQGWGSTAWMLILDSFHSRFQLLPAQLCLGFLWLFFLAENLGGWMCFPKDPVKPPSSCSVLIALQPLLILLVRVMLLLYHSNF